MTLRVLEGGRRRHYPGPLFGLAAGVVLSWAIFLGLVLTLWRLLEWVWP